MKVSADAHSNYDYSAYLYIDKENPLGKMLIREDAPEWAKKAYESDLKLYEDAYKKGRI